MRLRFLVFFLLIIAASQSVKGQLVYLVTSVLPTELAVVDLSNGCSTTYIGPIIDQAGNGVNGLDIAICPDGSMYVTDGANLYSVDPVTAQATLIGNMGALLVNSLACDGLGQLYGAGFALYEIDPLNASTTNLGNLPFPAGGDMVFYGGTAYYVTLSGLYELDLNNPVSSPLVMGVSNALWGLAGYYDSCDQIISSTPLGEMYLLDPSTQTQTLICTVPFLTTGLASLDDFNPPPSCSEFVLDLDENDSSGANGADYNAVEVDCAMTSTAIADSDVLIETGFAIDAMTITIANPLDLPFEFLSILAPPPGLLVTGNGTTTLTLTNLGPATTADFATALTQVLYENTADPATAGMRLVEVSYLSSTGEVSNTATANINVVSTLPIVELGPAQIFCEGEQVVLDAGNPGGAYQWSTGQQTQVITVSNAGLYSVTVTDANGCSATDDVLISFVPLTTVSLGEDQVVCIGEPAVLTISVNGAIPVDVVIEDQATGIQIPLNGIAGTVPVQVFPVTNTTYFISSVAAAGVPACVDPVGQGTAVVSVGLPIQTPLDVEICTGDSLFLENAWQTEPGVYFDTLQTSLGCDSVLITTLALLPADTTLLNSITCDSSQAGVFETLFTAFNGCDSLVIEELSFAGSPPTLVQATSCNPASVGLDTLVLTNSLGCDSILITETTLLLSDTTLVNEFTCDSDQAGTTELLLQNVEGCDSLVITTLVFVPADTTVINTTTCDPAMEGVFSELLVGAAGCDSLVITNIALLSSDTTFLQETTCDEMLAGQEEVLLSNQFGCDSLVVIQTSFIPGDTTTLFQTSCDPNEVGTTEQLLSNQFGCDSLVIVETSLLPSDTTALQQTSCDPAQTGVEEVLLSNQFGCDSLLIITTTFAEADSTNINLFSCDPSEVGQVVDVLMSTDGCDSLVVTTTSLLPSDTTYLTAASCDPDEVGETQELLQNSLGCDSLVVTTTSLLSSDTTYLTAASCDPDEVGETQELLQNSLGCDSLVVTTTSLLPSDTTYLTAASCDPADVGETQELLQNSLGCDSLVVTTTSLLSSDTTYLTAASCDPDEVGETQEVLQNSLGCDSLVVTTTSLLSSDTTYLTAASCDPDEVGETQELLQNSLGCDSLVVTTTSLLSSDTTLILEVSCSVLDTGLVITSFTNQSGCDSLVLTQTDLAPPIDCVLDAVAIGDTIGCDTPFGEVVVELLSGAFPYSWTWTDQNGYSASGSIAGPSTVFTLSDLPPGTYMIDIVDGEGLSASLQVAIVQAEPMYLALNILSDYNGFSVSCAGATDGAATAAVIGGGVGPFTYSWSEGSVGAVVDELPSGWISVVVEDALGCIRGDSIELLEPDSIMAALLFSDPDCFSEEEGAIQVDSVWGGVSPYAFAINQGVWQTGSLFEGLESGNYLLEIADANGCVAEIFGVINPIPEILVELGLDTSILLGDSLMLDPVVNLPPGSLDSIYWAGVECPDCSTVVIAPLVSGTYSVTVVDSLGCRGYDEISVMVEESSRIFVPNAFSPDADGINDYFTIFAGPEVVVIREFQIYSRWGEVVFSGRDLPANRPTLGWDGTFRGTAMNPGVFVYWAELELVDGSRLLVKGDVTLIR